MASPMKSGSVGGSACRGFTFVFVLVSIAIIGMTSAAAVTVGYSMSRREAEGALLDAGDEFRRALDSYRNAPSSAQVYGPRDLMDLVRDPRAVEVRRHIRRIPIDPMTGRNDWAVVRDGSGAIVAVHSVSDQRPLKKAGFEPHQSAFEGADRYADWVFSASLIGLQK
jgi:type II secretory pathway pseudopilin PulG